MVSAIIVAAGSSSRMGFDKLLASLAGKPVIAHTVEAFARTDAVTEIVVVGRSDRLTAIREAIGRCDKLADILPGGEHRQDSVRAGLGKIAASARFVAIHDAARPLITPELIGETFELARLHGAASLAAAVTDTLKRADEDRCICGGVDRANLSAMQTPQIFERLLLEEAYAAVVRDGIAITDDASAVEHIGRKVFLLPNPAPNLKITYAADLDLAEAIVARRA
jgi:2-C-methyl-D-erythritol 4-phosphate cytidylyltransferase